MASLRVNLLALLVSSLLAAPQARLLRVRPVVAPAAANQTKAEVASVGAKEVAVSDANANLTAELDDAVVDVRAEAGVATADAEAGVATADVGARDEVNARGGEHDADEHDYTQAPVEAKLVGEVDDVEEDDEAEAGAHPEVEEDPSEEDREGVFNLETGRFDKAAVLLQTADVDNTDDQEQAIDDSEEDETVSDDTDPNEDKASNSEALVQTRDVDDDDDEEATESDDTDPNEDKASNSESLLQLTRATDDDDDDDDATVADLGEDDKSGDEDAKKAEAEAVKEMGGEEDEEKKAEREEAEQEEIESLNADAQYNFDGN